MSADVVITLLYFLLVICTLFPPPECVSAGFTIETIFSRLLGNEAQGFIHYHLRRTTLTLFVYSMLPFVYSVLVCLFGEEDGILLMVNSEVVKLFVAVAVILPVLALRQIHNYYLHDWEKHPIIKNLRVFCVGEVTLESVIRRIDLEYCSIDKVIIQTSSITKIIATEGWVMKVTPLNVIVVDQRDASFVVEQSDTHHLSHLNTGIAQIITIDVKPARGTGFKVRLNAHDFRDLQDRISQVITVLPQVKFHKTLVEKFLQAFREAVRENPTYISEEVPEQCLGCMQNVSNVKISRLCQLTTRNPCQDCRCKPMWCVDCMGRWFAHKQDEEAVDSWLSNKCTCPICRSTFCLLDVLYVET